MYCIKLIYHSRIEYIYYSYYIYDHTAQEFLSLEIFNKIEFKKSPLNIIKLHMNGCAITW
jgi:hypothetical protein